MLLGEARSTLSLITLGFFNFDFWFMIITAGPRINIFLFNNF